MNQDLQKHIEAMHAELSRIDTVDPQSRTLLITLLGDITRLLENSSDTPANQHNLAERLDELAVHFEAEHPSLGTALRRVVDALGKAGI